MDEILTIGTATQDVFLKSDLFKIVRDKEHLSKMGFPSGEAQCFALGGKLEIGEPIITVGGGAANAAVTFARQGFKTASLFKIGRDDGGEAVVGALRADKVRSLPVFDKKVMTAYSVILLSPSGERTILNFRGASEDLAVKEIDPVYLRAKAAYVAPGRIPFQVMSEILKIMDKQGSFVAMNPSKHYLGLGRRFRLILSLLDVVIMNKEEAAYLTGVPYEKSGEVFRAFAEMVRGVAVMTDGPNGVSVTDGNKFYKAGIFKEKKIADRTGAGDAFGSGFVAGLLRSGKKNSFSEKDIIEAIRIGSANATSVVEHVGAEPGILSRKEAASSPRWKRLKIEIKKI